VQVLHDHARRAARQADDLVHLGDVLAAEAGERAGLAQEALLRLAARERLRREELQRDELAALGVSGREDRAHAALAEHALDAVLPQQQVPRRDTGTALSIPLLVGSGRAH
jgi:hypothetical protein